MAYAAQDPLVMSQVFSLVAREVRRASSESDLKKRLASKGYGIRKSPQGRVLVTMPHGVELGLLPLG
ncbi:hypothetical protein [Pseudaestuariivita atlantica]|uniref:hypothetical protein n=1 Tax=Pseudaestuariivita atlantica TaxID=1317121 RepID=UPI00106C9E93|nr:hypothetical protein [Pseudaestuariivita atlantica]